MLRTIKAPEGYEGSVHYDDGAKSWRPAFRRIGETFWTLAYRDAGHAYLPEEEVTARAEAAIADAIRIRAAG